MFATGRIERIETRSLARAPAVQILRLTLTGPFRFAAGQYVEVVHPDGTPIPLSIASPPESLPGIVLHYRSTPGSPEAVRMDALLRQAGTLQIRGPAGEVRLEPEDHRPLLLVCGGTGISQALCLAAAQRLRHPASSVELLACADDPADFYFDDLLPDGAAATLIADANRDASNRGLNWLARRAAALANDTQIIISGSPPFVWAVTDVLTGAGIEPGRLASDVYAWAPRP